MDSGWRTRSSVSTELNAAKNLLLIMKDGRNTTAARAVIHDQLRGAIPGGGGVFGGG